MYAAVSGSAPVNLNKKHECLILKQTAQAKCNVYPQTDHKAEVLALSTSLQGNLKHDTGTEDNKCTHTYMHIHIRMHAGTHTTYTVLILCFAHVRKGGF